jgi:pimeloyl-[acyl-carrier protein] synthase
MNEKINNKTVPLPFNPRSPEFRANPYPTYRYLQTHHPIYYRPDKKDWVLTRYADIAEVLKNPNMGHSEGFLAGSQEPMKKNDIRDQFLFWRQESQKIIKLWVIQRNPPEHTQLRQILRTLFTPFHLQNLRSQIQTQANQILNLTQDLGKMDVIHDLAYPLTMHTICQILGILPQEQHPHFSKWSQELFVLLDLDVSPLDSERGLFTLGGLAEYFRTLIAQYRSSSEMPNHFIGQLIQAQIEGQLSEEEAIAHCILVWSGHSTIKHSIGNCILTLLKHPDRLQLLQANPSLIETTITEALRYESPFHITSRTAFADLQLSNQTIQKGQIVHCILGAGNRDPAQFPNPDQFNIQRTPNPYLSFGKGIHNCLGKHLGKLVAEIAVGTLVERFPNLSLATDSIEWEDSFLGRGLKSLPVVF